MKTIITGKAPAAIGTYSQATAHGNTLYISGQIPLDPVTMAPVEGDTETQVRQTFTNLSAIAEAAGTGLEKTLKLNIYFTDLSSFGIVNRVMADIFSEPYPARAVIQASALPRGVQVEIDAILALT